MPLVVYLSLNFTQQYFIEKILIVCEILSILPASKYTWKVPLQTKALSAVSYPVEIQMIWLLLNRDK